MENKFDIEDVELIAGGKAVYASVKFSFARKAVDHRHNPQTGKGQDIFADVAVAVESFDIASVDGSPLSDALKNEIAETVLREYADDSENFRNVSFGHWE